MTKTEEEEKEDAETITVAMANKAEREDNERKWEATGALHLNSGWSIAHQTNGENFINFEAVVYT